MQTDTESFAIFGGGFGLYGYLPALIKVFGGRILLPAKYRKAINDRRELTQYDSHIDWQPTTDMLLAKASGVVIAIPPGYQFEIMKDVLGADNIRKIVIEKPVAPTPDAAMELFNDPLMQSKELRVGYLFLYTDWYPLLAEVTKISVRQLRIIWHFEADHIFKNKETWKRYHSLGGGVLRFYGIHLIAVLSSLGYKDVYASKTEFFQRDEPLSWSAKFDGCGVPQCEICIKTNSKNSQFSIGYFDNEGRERILYSESSPFLNPNKHQMEDSRVPVLEKLIRSFDGAQCEFDSLYRKTNILWGQVESTNTSLQVKF